jgi:hypothetical protein
MDRPKFDPEIIVGMYRYVVNERDTTKDEMQRAELAASANGLREWWKELKGTDDLHEHAFGEPFE